MSRRADSDLRRSMDLRRRLADLNLENLQLRGQNDSLIDQLKCQKDRNCRLAERLRVNNLMRIAALRLRVPQEQVMERFYRWYDQQVMGHTGGQDE
jgi:hypothetical protein